MPCRSDYLEPSSREKESLRVIKFLEELNQRTGKYDKNYGRTFTIDIDTQQLCNICKKIDVKDYSLELQIWWRDHQKADKEREAEARRKKANELIKQRALKKLTPEEKKALGL